MRKYLIIGALFLLAACKPEVYLGPLDSPLGNWKSLSSKLYFDGENVFEDTLCFYPAISFYKDTLCCIEGVKGAFAWSYESDRLIVDSVEWKAVELTGKQMALDYIGRLYAPEDSMLQPAEENSEEESAEEEGELPRVEYKGKTIETDGLNYWYTDESGMKVPCYPREQKEEDGTVKIICWWDTRSDLYKPF